MTAMLPARAVEMQKSGMSAGSIARTLGVTMQRVVMWWRDLGYDPVEYHAETIAKMVQGGATVLAAMQAIGVSDGTPRVRINAMLEARGITFRHTRAPLLGRGHCARCGILLEPFDPENEEQGHWQNGTRDGTHCTQCERQMGIVAPEGQL